jgi:hypothetical protein
MFTSIHQPLATLGVIAAVGGGSAAISAAASDDASTSASSTSTAAPAAGHGTAAAPNGNAGFPGERPLSGETADKVEKAALAEVAGGTIVRVETDANHGSPYEAHVRKPDGTEVEVLVNKDFAVTRVVEMRRP